VKGNAAGKWHGSRRHPTHVLLFTCYSLSLPPRERLRLLERLLFERPLRRPLLELLLDPPRLRLRLELFLALPPLLLRLPPLLPPERRRRVAAPFLAALDRLAFDLVDALFRPPLRDALLLDFFPRPDPLFLPPPSSLFTVAHARRAASRRDTPRFS
jgi:hypothetical protein